MSTLHTPQHTPEPWFVVSYNDNTKFGIAYIADDIDQANAERIAACVNSCKNVPNEWLYENAVYALIEERENLKRQREELLEALKAVTEELNQQMRKQQVLTLTPAERMAEDVIKKATK